MVFNNPNQPCYTQFFVGGVPPTGLRTGQNLQNVSYICQMVNQRTYYGTMFDENRGIAVFSAYAWTQLNVNFQRVQPRPRWQQTPGSYNLATYRRIFVYNICLITISDTVSEGATKRLILNIERAQHD